MFIGYKHNIILNIFLLIIYNLLAHSRCPHFPAFGFLIVTDRNQKYTENRTYNYMNVSRNCQRCR